MDHVINGLYIICLYVIVWVGVDHLVLCVYVFFLCWCFVFWCFESVLFVLMFAW